MRRQMMQTDSANDWWTMPTTVDVHTARVDWWADNAPAVRVPLWRRILRKGN